MSRSFSSARHVLVVAPHPDDEVIGAWALIRWFRKAGASIELVVVSDGGASHPDSRRWPRERLVRERRRETRRAMASVGVTAEAIHFLDLPDGGLAAASRHVRLALAKWLARRPDLIVGPEVGDAHPDHRAVAAALASLPQKGNRLGYHVWPEGAARGARPVRIPLDTIAMAMKRRAVIGYRTQAGMIADAEAGFAMTHRHLRAFVRPTENFAVLR